MLTVTKHFIDAWCRFILDYTSYGCQRMYCLYMQFNFKLLFGYWVYWYFNVEIGHLYIIILIHLIHTQSRIAFSLWYENIPFFPWWKSVAQVTLMDVIGIISRAPLSRALCNRVELGEFDLRDIELYGIIWSGTLANLLLVLIKYLESIDTMFFPQPCKYKTDNINYFFSISDIDLIDYEF